MNVLERRIAAIALLVTAVAFFGLGRATGHVRIETRWRTPLHAVEVGCGPNSTAVLRIWPLRDKIGGLGFGFVKGHGDCWWQP